jgi:hypothetical protein
VVRQTETETCTCEDGQKTNRTKVFCTGAHNICVSVGLCFIFSSFFCFLSPFTFRSNVLPIFALGRTTSVFRSAFASSSPPSSASFRRLFSEQCFAHQVRNQPPEGHLFDWRLGLFPVISFLLHSPSSFSSSSHDGCQSGGRHLFLLDDGAAAVKQSPSARLWLPSLDVGAVATVH